MSQRITIDPVTRIEGHARVILDLSDDESVEFAGLVVNELRGFERILVGMKADMMPLITARICGVCPTSHHIVATKALDNAFGVEPPPAGKLLRELLYMGHFIHSHGANIFALAGPDLIFGLDGDPAKRNIVGIVEANPDLAKKALRLRSLGQKINEMVGGRGVHPVSSVAGGMALKFTEEMRDKIQGMTDEGLQLLPELAAAVKGLLLQRVEETPELVEKLTQSTAYLSMVHQGGMNFYEGDLHIMGADGKIVTSFPGEKYADFLREKPVDWSYMKPVVLTVGGEEIPYQVGTLARLNLAESIGTPLAQQEMEAFRESFGRPSHKTVLQLYARLIEMVHACEKAKQIVEDPAIMGVARVDVKIKAGRGVGVVEAPRGVLIHDYEIDDQGIVRKANLIVATQQNYNAINESIKQSVETFVAGKGDDKVLNAVEFAIRCYDPCLSCATHAVGRMPLQLEIRQEGRVVRKVRRT